MASDAWFPQVNGVVRTLSRVRAELEAQGHVFEVICPDQFRTIPCPSYPEIRLAILPGRGLARRIEAAAPDTIHIARSEEHTSELQSLMRISYAVFCLKKKKNK